MLTHAHYYCFSCVIQNESSGATFMDKYLGDYMEKTLKYVPPNKKATVSLKTIYLDYKNFLKTQQLQPLRYTNFRHEFINILDITSKNAPPEHNSSMDNITVELYKNRWVVRNVQLVTKITPQTLYNALYLQNHE